MSLETPDAIAGDLLARLPGSPDIYPQKLDLVRDAVLLVRFSRAQYLAASFLDDRILGPNLAGACVPAGTVVDAASRLASSRPVHFIFHTGHVGSTLVSRLLDETGTMLSLREPLPLRSLAEAHDVLTQPDSLIECFALRPAAGGVHEALESRLCRHPQRGREGDQQRRASRRALARAERGDARRST